MPNRTPQPSDVYRDERGRLALFVRTEQRQGTSPETGAGNDVPEHLFVVVMPDVRHFGTRWLRADEPLPERLELVVNAGAEARIVELEGQVRELEAERSALTSAMKQAVGALPPAVANHLREVYRQTRGQLLTKAAT